MKKHQDIEKLAYELFEKSGRAHGRDLEHWLEAEQIVSARRMTMHAKETEAAASKKRAVQRADVRRHEIKKTGRTKKTKG